MALVSDYNKFASFFMLSKANESHSALTSNLEGRWCFTSHQWSIEKKEKEWEQRINFNSECLHKFLIFSFSFSLVAMRSSTQAKAKQTETMQSVSFDVSLVVAREWVEWKKERIILDEDACWLVNNNAMQSTSSKMRKNTKTKKSAFIARKVKINMFSLQTQVSSIIL